jgi:hypothetical protein
MKNLTGSKYVKYCKQSGISSIGEYNLTGQMQN